MVRLCCLLVLVVQVSVVASAHTFLHPGLSYLEYQPTWNPAAPQTVAFSFRTQTPNAVLLHYSIHGDWDEYTTPPVLQVTLAHGQLLASFSFNGSYDEVSAAKGLSNDRWHAVMVTLTGLDSTLTVGVDMRPSRTLGIPALGQLVGDVGSSEEEDEETRDSQVTAYIGGFAPKSGLQASKFVGCVKDVNFYSDGQRQDLIISGKADLLPGCQDKCSDHTNPVCENFGRCVNHYTHTSCDCYNTGFQGDFCETKELTTVTLEGGEWVSHWVYDDTDAHAHAPNTRIALSFRTSTSEGVLFYAREKYPEYNHVAVSLHNSSLHVSVVFVDHASFNELFVSMGTGLDDGRWHQVLVSHSGRDVDVTLDDDVEKMTSAHSHPHLHMPQTVFFGGIEVTTEALGLRSTENFIGCLRGLYFNHISVLEQLNTSRTSYHGNPIQYGCQNLNETCMQFTTDGAFIQLEHEAAVPLEVELEFRTLKKDGIIYYGTVSSGQTQGYAQIVLKEGRLRVTLATDDPESDLRLRPTITSGNYLHDNQWHEVKVTYKNGLVRVTLDAQTSVMPVDDKVLMTSASFMGFRPDVTRMKAGYIGCMRHVHIQNIKVEPVETVHSQGDVGVTLGTCDLHDWCMVRGSKCQNGGVCVSEWMDTYCDCRRTHYEGFYCQFSELRGSCAELYKDGYVEDGVYQLDPGATGATYVFCDMGVTVDGQKTGVTKVEHNLEPQTRVRDRKLKDMKKVLSYRAMTSDQLVGLVAVSAACQQHVSYSCRNAPIWMGRQTWLTSAGGQEVGSLASTMDKACSCHDDGSCIDPKYKCNCDAALPAMVSDEGDITEKSQLPVTELSFLQRGGGSGQANVTLGPLQCSGTVNEVSDSYVKFVSRARGIEVGGWAGGAIRFSFRTTSADAVLLYQGSEDQVQMLLAIVEERHLLVEFSSPQVTKTLELASPVNTGRWQHVGIEPFMGQVRIIVNGEKFMLNGAMMEAETFNGDIVISGDNSTDTPDDLVIGGSIATGSHTIDGLEGCFGALEIDGRTLPLAHMVDTSAGGVEPGCDAHCDRDPCMFGARCEELWSSYKCHCYDPVAQSGVNCEKNINLDVIHFESPGSFVEFHSLQPFTDGDIMLSFRTRQRNALVFYWTDDYNNVLQLEVRGSNDLVLVHNAHDTIHEFSLTVPELSDGSWKRVVVTLQGHDITVAAGDRSASNQIPWVRLTQYKQVPYRSKESVRPLRTLSRPHQGISLYVGGVPGRWTQLAMLDDGCVRGLVMAGQQLYMQQAGMGKPGVLFECANGCDYSPCQHNGRCVESPNYTAEYSCECSMSGYAGSHCDEVSAVYLDGRSLIMEKLKTKSTSEVAGDFGGHMQQIQLQFALPEASPGSPSRGGEKVGLVFTQGAGGLSDYMLVYITPHRSVGAQLNVKGKLVRLDTGVPFTSTNGHVHQVHVSRSAAAVTLVVDGDAEVSATLDNDPQADPVEFVLVGGVRAGNFRTELDGFANFTGDIANVFVLTDRLSPPYLNLAPLDVYLGVREPAGIIHSEGSVRVSQHPGFSEQESAGSVGEIRQPPYDVDSEDNGAEHAGLESFPPWEVAAAETVELKRVVEAAPLEQEAAAARAGASAGKPEAYSGLELHGSIGYLIGAAVLVVMASFVGVMCYRHRREHHLVTLSDPIKDEEEGVELLDVETPGPSGTGGSFRGVNIRTEAGSSSGKRKAPSLHDVEEEDEDSPMLPNMQQTATSTPAKKPAQQELEAPPPVSHPPLVTSATTPATDPVRRKTPGSPKAQAWTESQVFEQLDDEPTWDPSVDNGGAMYTAPVPEEVPQPVRSAPVTPRLRHNMPPATPEVIRPREGSRGSYYSSAESFMTAASGPLGLMESLKDEEDQEYDDDDEVDEEAIDRTLTRDGQWSVTAGGGNQWGDEKPRSSSVGGGDDPLTPGDLATTPSSSEASTVVEAPGYRGRPAQLRIPPPSSKQQAQRPTSLDTEPAVPPSPKPWPTPPSPQERKLRTSTSGSGKSFIVEKVPDSQQQVSKQT